MDSKTQIYNFVTGDTAFDSVIHGDADNPRCGIGRYRRVSPGHRP